MEPLRITRSPGRAWLADSRTSSGTTPMPVVLMNRPSPLPFSTTLVSPVTMATPACRGRSRHRCRDPPQVSVRETFFENECRAQKQRPRTAHRQIVHRPVHRQRSDVAAGKKQRLDHERVRGEGDARSADLENRLIVHAIEHRVREQRQKNVAQQTPRSAVRRCRVRARSVRPCPMRRGQVNDSGFS